MYQRGGGLEFLSRGATSLEFPGEPSNAVTTSSHPLPKFLYSPVMVFAARRALRSSEKFQRRHNVIKKYFYVSRSAEGGGLEKKIERGEGIFVERFDFNYEQRSYTFSITAIPPVLLYFSCEEERVAPSVFRIGSNLPIKLIYYVVYNSLNSFFTLWIDLIFFKDWHLSVSL